MFGFGLVWFWFVFDDDINLTILILMFPAWGNLANILNNQHRHVEAEEAYRNALQYRGNMADVHYNL